MRLTAIVLLYLMGGLFTSLYYEQKFERGYDRGPGAPRILLVAASWPIMGWAVLTANYPLAVADPAAASAKE